MDAQNLSIYTFHEKKIRTQITDKNEILFCLSDVCGVLNLTNTSVIASQIKAELGGGGGVTWKQEQ